MCEADHAARAGCVPRVRHRILFRALPVQTDRDCAEWWRVNTHGVPLFFFYVVPRGPGPKKKKKKKKKKKS